MNRPVPKVRWAVTDYKHLGHSRTQILWIGRRKIPIDFVEEADTVNYILKILADMGAIEYVRPPFDQDT